MILLEKGKSWEDQAIHFTETRTDQTERAACPQGPVFEQDKHKPCN